MQAEHLSILLEHSGRIDGIIMMTSSTHLMLVSDSGMTVIITGDFSSFDEDPTVEPMLSFDIPGVTSTLG